MRHNDGAQACVLADAKSAAACVQQVSAPVAAGESAEGADERENQRLDEEAALSAAIRNKEAAAASEAELAQREREL